MHKELFKILILPSTLVENNSFSANFTSALCVQTENVSTNIKDTLYYYYLRAYAVKQCFCYAASTNRRLKILCIFFLVNFDLFMWQRIIVNYFL